MGDAGFFAMFLMVGGIGVSLFLGPVGVALGRRLTGKPGGDGLSTGEMAAERVGQLEARVQELEERLDFAERMLSRGENEPALLTPPDGAA
ncbi:MAG: hypothetical protein R2882_08745 [Gemmatimonadales bacterium]